MYNLIMGVFRIYFDFDYASPSERPLVFVCPESGIYWIDGVNYTFDAEQLLFEIECFAA